MPMASMHLTNFHVPVDEVRAGADLIALYGEIYSIQPEWIGRSCRTPV
jgi:hypothetical protein